MTIRSETFGRLVRGALNAIVAFEGKTAAVVEEEFGAAVGLSGFAVQRWKQGMVPPDLRAVEILARAGVQRGHLDREWLIRMLKASRYPDPDVLVAELRPIETTISRPPRARDNLPAPTYSQFIMREEVFNEVIEGLRQRSAVVAIISLGGMGKTSLALEAAKSCLDTNAGGVLDKRGYPRFDAAVWVSDRDNPGVTSLSTVLNELARTLDLPGHTQLTLVDKRYEIEQLLRRQRVLLVVDNFETIKDADLLRWLLRLPEPSKALVTTRVHRQEFQRGAWIVELSGMSEGEIGALIDQRVRRPKLITIDREAIRSRLLEATGGNPQAITLVLGHIQYSRRSLETVLDEMRQPEGELISDIFDLSWSTLNSTARMILMALAIFPASVRRAAVATVAELDQAVFERALRQLIDLALVEIEAPDADEHHVRLAIHPLTRAYVSAHLRTVAATEAALRDQFFAWCITYANECGGYTTDNIGSMAALDSEEPLLFGALEWAARQGYHRVVISIAKAIEYFYYVRALWGKKLQTQSWYIDAARASGDVAEEIFALALHIQLLSHQGHLREVKRYLIRLDEIVADRSLTGEMAFYYHHTRGMFLLAQADTNLSELQAAQGHWLWLIENSEGQAEHMLSGAYHWLGVCFARQGNVEAARQSYNEALTIAERHRSSRLIARNQLQLARLDIDAGDLDAAEERIRASQSLTAPDDWEQQAQIQFSLARLSMQRGDAVALGQYHEARRLFERMGLVYELNLVIAEIGNLNV